MSKIYLDNAATTPLDKEVRNAMIDDMDTFGNPSSLHASGRESKALLEGCRRTVSSALHCLPSEIVFTSGGTEADNLAILGLVEANDIKTIISSPIEHHAVIDSISQANKLFGVKVEWVHLLSNGEIDLNHLDFLLEENPSSLVSLMHVNNEIGNVLDIESVGKTCRSHQAIFHSDMVQSIGRFPINLNELPVDAVSVSAHKINGPKGSGLLYLRKGVKLASQTFGGKQEREARTGTENVLGIVGLSKALELTDKRLKVSNDYITELKQYFISQIQSNLEGVTFNGNSGDMDKSSNTILSMNFPMISDNELLLFQLDLQGVMISGGSACSSGSHSGSHVLNGLGIEGASIRFSLSKCNTKEEVDRVIEILKDVIKK